MVMAVVKAHDTAMKMHDWEINVLFTIDVCDKLFTVETAKTS